MKKDTTVLKDKMSFILSQTELYRVHIYEDVDEVIVFKIDLHYMTAKAVKNLLDKTIILMKFPFRMDLIHGYSHGTVLKDLIQNDYENGRVSAMYSPDYNPGETILEVSY